jgi:hypothetical protein
VAPEAIEMDEEMEQMLDEDEEAAGDEDVGQKGQSNRYGGVPGLDDSELADPDELEQQVMLEEWGSVLLLPVQGRSSGIRGVVDEAGELDFGAFGTVDFERTMGKFDKARYKAQKLREQLKDLTIRIGIVKERLPGKAKYLVLKYLRMGTMELDQVKDTDMLILARLYLRAKRLRHEIRRLEEAGGGRCRSRCQQ